MVLITITMGQAKDDLDTMREMMAEMKMEMMAEMIERLSLAEEKLAKTEDELALSKEEFAASKAILSKTIIDQAEAHDDMMAEMKMKLAMYKAKTDLLKREVAILKAPPYIHACGSHYDRLSGSSGTIPYTSLLYSSTNTEGGGLDIATGVFTAPHGGSYTVYWDTSASLDSGEVVSIYLQKNGETIQESLHGSLYTGPDVMVDQGRLLPHSAPSWVLG